MMLRAGCAIDRSPESLYSTNTRWSAAGESRPACKGFNGQFVPTRAVYVLLSERRRAGVFHGLDSEDEVSGDPRPTAREGAVGLCF